MLGDKDNKNKPDPKKDEKDNKKKIQRRRILYL